MEKEHSRGQLATKENDAGDDTDNDADHVGDDEVKAWIATEMSTLEAMVEVKPESMDIEEQISVEDGDLSKHFAPTRDDRVEDDLSFDRPSLATASAPKPRSPTSTPSPEPPRSNSPALPISPSKRVYGAGERSSRCMSDTQTRRDLKLQPLEPHRSPTKRRKTSSATHLAWEDMASYAFLRGRLADWLQDSGGMSRTGFLRGLESEVSIWSRSIFAYPTRHRLMTSGKGR